MQAEKPLVLVADDEKNAVLLLRRILEREGFRVDSAGDGVEALEKARTLRPDLILMDVQMPRMGGFEVVARLREDPTTARIPVIFVTAAAREPSDVAHGLQLGADDYIRKPYNHHELTARAISKMRARQLEDRLQRRSEELEALVRIGAEFNRRLAIDELAERIASLARDEFKAELAELYLFDEAGQPIFFFDSARGMRPIAEAQALLARPATIAAQVARSGEPVLIGGAEPGPEPPEGMRSAAAAPLRHGGTLVGVLIVAHRAENHFGASNLRMLRSISEQAALAVRNAQLHAALQSYAQNLETMVDDRTRELRSTQAQLIQSEKLAALGRLAAGIAHEVNNPLQPVLNCLEDALEDLREGRAVEPEGLRVAEIEVQRIKSIVSRLLDFSRPSTSETVPISLPSVLREVLLLVKKELERKQITLRTDLRETPCVMGSPTQLKQVALNLVLNAMQAMPGGGEIALSVQPEGQGVSLVVQDSGVGMDEATMSRIFEPFYSTKGDGTGLGLAVTYGIVQGHGGTIRAESAPGTGSKFVIWLPCGSG